MCDDDYDEELEDDTADEPTPMTDVEADSATLASAGHGTDEDYWPSGMDNYGSLE